MQPNGHTPRSSLSPADQQFVIQSSHMKIKFHVCDRNWFQHGKAPVLEDIGGLFKSRKVVDSPNAFCICEKSKQQKQKNISMRNILVSVAPLAVASWANCL